MNKIKFSHKYEKLIMSTGLVAPTAMLIQVLNVYLEELSIQFIAYDTDGVYQLPVQGEYLLLIIEKFGGIFTTLRRFTPNKNEYYRSKVGEYFEVIIEEK